MTRKLSNQKGMSTLVSAAGDEVYLSRAHVEFEHSKTSGMRKLFQYKNQLLNVI